jgi:hypothetical protein
MQRGRNFYVFCIIWMNFIVDLAFTLEHFTWRSNKTTAVGICPLSLAAASGGKWLCASVHRAEKFSSSLMAGQMCLEPIWSLPFLCRSCQVPFIQEFNFLCHVSCISVQKSQLDFSVIHGTAEVAYLEYKNRSRWIILPTCPMRMKLENYVAHCSKHILLRKPEEKRDRLEDLNVEGMLTLKWVRRTSGKVDSKRLLTMVYNKDTELLGFLTSSSVRYSKE